MLEKLEGILQRVAEKGNLFHAYLFFGENERAIFELSEKLANFLENQQWETPPRFLSDCLIIEKGTEENIGIDEARRLKNFLYQKPVVASRRTAIVYQADSLTEAAQNALLKIVEEPPGDTLLILIARREESLLPTLLSRLHRVYFPHSLRHNKRGNSKTEVFSKKENRSQSETDKKLEDFFDKFFSSAIDDQDNLVQNSYIAQEMLERLKVIRQFNLNKPLQLKFLNLLSKKPPSAK